MKIDLTTGTWQDNPECPINITLVSTSDANKQSMLLRDFEKLVGVNLHALDLICLHNSSWNSGAARMPALAPLTTGIAGVTV